MTKALRYNAPSFVPQSDTLQSAATVESLKMAQPTILQESRVPQNENPVSSNTFQSLGTVFTPSYEDANFISALSSSILSRDLSASDLPSTSQPGQEALMEVQYPNFPHPQSSIHTQIFFQPQTVIQGQHKFTWPSPALDCQNWYQGSLVQTGFQPQVMEITPTLTENPRSNTELKISKYQDGHEESKSEWTSETEYFPEIYVDFVVTDTVNVNFRVQNYQKHVSDVECITPPTGRSGLSAGAKEFVPGTPHVKISSPRTPLNGTAPVFVSRVLPNMTPDQEVVYPNVYEPVFFPRWMPEFEEFQPFDGVRWTNYSTPLKKERYIPPNKYQFKTVGDLPHPETLKKSYPIDMLLAMRCFFAKPTDSIIDVFLNNPATKGAQKICTSVEENILIRLAVANGEYQDRFPSKESEFQLSPLILPKKRKKWKKKTNATSKKTATTKNTSSSSKSYQLEKTSEHTIKPNIREQNRIVERKALVDKKSFVKRFKCILNKITPENMEVMTSEVRCLGDEWSEDILKTAVSLIHANVIRNAAFAPVYSEFSMRISDLFPELNLFKRFILDNIKETLNLKGDPECEPKDSIFLSKRLKKVNISNLLGELFLKNLMEIDEIFKVSRALIDAFSDQICGYRELCLECLVDLVKICGSKLQLEDQETLEDMIAQLAVMSHDENIPKRIRFLLDNVIELSNNEWVSCRSKKEVQPQRINDLRAEFMATHPQEHQSRHLHSPKSNRSGKTSPKSKKRFKSRRLVAKSKKPHSKERGLPKKFKTRPFLGSTSFSGGVIKSKMNYRMAARTAAEKRRIAEKDKMLERVEVVVKSMDFLEMKKFTDNNPDWRTFLLQRLLRKWKLRPYRKAVRMIIEELHVEAITTSELHEAFRKCGITEKEFTEDSGSVKSPKTQSCRLPASKFFPNPQHRPVTHPIPLDVSDDEEK